VNSQYMTNKDTEEITKTEKESYQKMDLEQVSKYVETNEMRERPFYSESSQVQIYEI
ncbi:36781_t:CDS:1, partial [Gigaspora margarita]